MESPDDLNDFASSDPSTSEEPSLKRRRQNEIGDTEVTTMDKVLVANCQFVDLAESMRALTLEADLTETAPESLTTLQSSIAKLELRLSELKQVLELAEQRAKLDPDHFQSTDQYGINPLFLTEKCSFDSGSKIKFAIEKIIDNVKRIELVRREKGKDEESLGLLPIEYKTIKLTVGDVCYKDVRYQESEVSVKQFSHRTEAGTLKNGTTKYNDHVFLCPFYPICCFWIATQSQILSHICSHFSAPIFFCFKCRFASVRKTNIVSHSKVCAPHLTEQSDTDTYVALAKSKKITFSDFQSIARQLWDLGRIDEQALQLSRDKLSLLKNHFLFIFNLPPIVSLNTEFDRLLEKLCPRNANPNDYRAIAYAVFETTKALDKKSAPIQVKYAGSEFRLSRRNEKRHREMINDVNLKSQTFHVKLAVAKRKGRTFSIVPLLTGIRNDKQLQDGSWNKARHTVEDAFKTMFECLSEDLWNKCAVSRNSNNDTYLWPTEKRMLFAFYIYRRQWEFIKSGLDNEKNQL